MYLVFNYSYKPISGDEVAYLRDSCGFEEGAEFKDIRQYSDMRVIPEAKQLVGGGMPYILLLSGDAFEALKGLAHARAHGLWSDEVWPVVVIRHFGKSLILLDMEEFIQSRMPPEFAAEQQVIAGLAEKIKDDGKVHQA